MKTYYYLSDIPESMVDLHIGLVKEIYTGMVDEFTRKSPRENMKMYSGKELVTNDIFDLDPELKQDDIEGITDFYHELLLNKTTIKFDRSKQCNSEYIYKQLESLGLDDWDSFKKLLILAIGNYREEMHDEYVRRRKHVFSARANGHKMGIKKGEKLITKKSIEMKAKIKSMCKDFDGDMADIDVRKELGIAKNTYFKYKREIKAEFKKK